MGLMPSWRVNSFDGLKRERPSRKALSNTAFFCCAYIDEAEISIAVAAPATSRQTKCGHSKMVGLEAISWPGKAGTFLIRRFRRFSEAHHRMARSHTLREYAWKCWRASATRSCSDNSGMHRRK